MLSHETLVRWMRCAIFAAILCICSRITVPVGTIPFSMAIFAVMLCAVVLDWTSGMIAVGVYLALGLFLPIFHGGAAGITAYPGPTGGFLWSFLLMIPVICGVRSLGANGFVWDCCASFLGCVLGIALCYCCGAAQYSIYAGVSFSRALGVCALPFILPDLIKAAAATLLGVTLRRKLAMLNLG